MLVISHTKQKKIICFGFLPGVLHGQTAQFLLCPVTHLRESNPAQQSHTIPYHTGKVCPADALSLESLATVVIAIQPPPPFLIFGSLGLWLGTSLIMWLPMKAQTHVYSSQTGHRQTNWQFSSTSVPWSCDFIEAPYCIWVTSRVADSKAAVSLKIVAQE